MGNKCFAIDLTDLRRYDVSLSGVIDFRLVYMARYVSPIFDKLRREGLGKERTRPDSLKSVAVVSGRFFE